MSKKYSKDNIDEAIKKVESLKSDNIDKESLIKSLKDKKDSLNEIILK